MFQLMMNLINNIIVIPSATGVMIFLLLLLKVVDLRGAGLVMT